MVGRVGLEPTTYGLPAVRFLSAGYEVRRCAPIRQGSTRLLALLYFAAVQTAR
jgi:hypothetical protein